MKKKYTFIAIVFISLCFFSCKKESLIATTEQIIQNNSSNKMGSYFPLAIGNEWNYKTTSTYYEDVPPYGVTTYVNYKNKKITGDTIINGLTFYNAYNGNNVLSAQSNQYYISTYAVNDTMILDTFLNSDYSAGESWRRDSIYMGYFDPGPGHYWTSRSYHIVDKNYSDTINGIYYENIIKLNETHWGHYEGNSTPSGYTKYYANDVGLIKIQDLYPPNSDQVEELEKFHLE